MKNTFSQGLPYPEAEDFGLGSLQLQVLAEAVDVKLSAAHARYDAVLDVETFLEGMTVAQNMSDGVKQIIFFNTLMYDSVGTGSLGPLFTMVDFSPGLYQAGMYVNTVPTGAVDAGSYRTIFLGLLDYRGPGYVDRYEEEWQLDGYETNTGGEYQTMHMTFELHSPERARLTPYFEHGNTSSTVNIAAGSYWWVSRIGDLGN